MLIFKVMETIHNVGAHHLAGYVITLCVESKKIKMVFETAHGESRFPKGLKLSPRGGKYFPKGLKCERIVYSERYKNKITSEESDTC